jgi:hypothetical protein
VSQLRSSDGARWLFVTATDDWHEADRMRAALHEQRERGEL